MSLELKPSVLRFVLTSRLRLGLVVLSLATFGGACADDEPDRPTFDDIGSDQPTGDGGRSDTDSNNDDDQCSDHSDCAINELCFEDTCQDEDDVLDDCDNDDDCPDDYICVERDHCETG